MAEKRPFVVLEREYQVKGVSAPPDWWETVDGTASEMGIGRSGLIRMAVNDYLKGARADVTDKENTPEPIAA